MFIQRIFVSATSINCVLLKFTNLIVCIIIEFNLYTLSYLKTLYLLSDAFLQGILFRSCDNAYVELNISHRNWKDSFGFDFLFACNVSWNLKSKN